MRWGADRSLPLVQVVMRLSTSSPDIELQGGVMDCESVDQARLGKAHHLVARFEPLDYEMRTGRGRDRGSRRGLGHRLPETSPLSPPAQPFVHMEVEHW